MICWIIVNVRWERLAIIRSYLSIIASRHTNSWTISRTWMDFKWRIHLSAGCFAIPSYWSTMVLILFISGWLDPVNVNPGSKTLLLWHLWRIMPTGVWPGFSKRVGYVSGFRWRTDPVNLNTDPKLCGLLHRPWNGIIIVIFGLFFLLRRIFLVGLDLWSEFSW